MEEADLVIIGAGISGLTMASTYHRIHPEAKMILLDAAPSIGGTWGSHRIFPGLRTNNLLGTLEHPDFPMDESYGVKPGEHIPAETTLKYLHDLAKWSGIEQFIRLETAVELVEKKESEWHIHCAAFTKQEKYTIKAQKLVFALGGTNKPNIPDTPRSATFDAPVIHSTDFARRYQEIVKPGRHTLVVGSGKSAYDAAYACASQPDSHVTLLIRPSGNGPIFMPPSHVTPFTLWLEKLVFTRLVGYFSPCPWAETTGPEGWARWFLQKTWLGRKLVAGLWHVLGEDAIALDKLDSHAEMKKFRPWRGAFEIGNALSINNYPTPFYELAREGKINVLFDDIASLEDRSTVRLKNQTDTLSIDAIIYATGWKSGADALNFKPATLGRDLGMPTRAPLSPDEAKYIQQTEAQVLADYPFLKERDTSRKDHPDKTQRYAQEPDTTQQPFRLYRFVAPLRTLQERSVAFIGAVFCLGTIPCAYLQSLWITAYMDGVLARPLLEGDAARDETFRNSQYCAVRGGHGRVLPDLVFDSLPYWDQILRDLGFSGKKKGGWLGFREAVQSYGPEDYRRVLEDVERTLYGRGTKKDI